MKPDSNRSVQMQPVRGWRESQDDPKAATRLIAQAIREAERAVRQRFPALRHQTAIGMGFAALAYAVAAVSGWLYLTGRLPACVSILMSGVGFAVLHEIEHDLIHNLYFRGNRRMQNLMLFIVWPARGNMPNPLYRRMIHLQHHRSSGRVEDLEERLIGNGTNFGPMRWFAILDTGLSTLFRRRELEQIPGFNHGQLLRNLLPVTFVFYLVWLSFLLYHAVALGLGLTGVALHTTGWLASAVRVIDAAVVVWALPNLIRQACLQFFSSTMHYYGDVEDTLQQTQVLSKWYWEPLQLLSCNFGRSHAIHHFVVNQPFYLREMVRREAHAAMREHGVRFDDLGTFKRANRWGAIQAVPQEPMNASAEHNGSAVCEEASMEIHARSEAGILFLRLQGRLEAIHAAEFEEKLQKSIDAGARRLAIDFSRLDYISASGLRVLLRVVKRLREADGKMALHSLNDRIEPAFHLTGFSSIFPIHRSQREAVVGLSTTEYVTVC